MGGTLRASACCLILALAACPSFDKKAVPDLPPQAVVAVTPAGPAGRGQRVTLDGSQSADPDGEPLTFRWEQLTGDPVALSSTREAVVSFDAPERPGVLTFSLVVSDGVHDSPPAYVRVEVEFNLRPVADAGQSREVINGTSVLLSGRATDPDGDEIVSYQWTVDAAPLASGIETHVLSGATSASAVFTPLVKGFFTLTLRVTDARDVESLPSTIVVRSLNATPVARAAPLVKGTNRSPIVLVAAASDVDPTDLLTYQWVLEDAPAGAALPELVGESSTELWVTPQGKGLYRFAFTASDGEVQSPPAHVLVSALNNRPAANTSAMTTPNLTPLALVAGASDLDGDPVTLEWSVVDPGGKRYTLAPGGGGVTLFTPHAQGPYQLAVVPFDGEERGAQVEVAVTSLNRPPVASIKGSTLVEVETGTQVALAGDAFDPDGDALTSYQWTVVDAPALVGAEPLYTMAAAGGGNAFFRPHAKGFYTLSFVATDPLGAPSLPALMVVQARNAPPVAFAGDAQKGRNLSAILLRGTATDPDLGDVLSLYQWTLESGPSGAALPDLWGETSTDLWVTPHGKGLYTFAFMASDGELVSAPSRVLLSSLNNPPTVTAADMTTPNLAQLVLAADTADLDGDPVQLRWSVMDVGTKSYTLGPAANGLTVFTPQGKGTYRLRVAPFDGEDTGAASDITVTATNLAPAAVAAASVETANGGEVFTLSAQGSYDPDGESLTYAWTRKQGSATFLTRTDAETARVAAGGTKGTLIFELVVRDPTGTASAPAQARVVVDNTPPVAIALVPEFADAGSTVELDATQSYDLETPATSLLYKWSSPSNTDLVFLPSDAIPKPRITLPVQVGGRVSLHLLVFDGQVASAPATVSVGIAATEALAIFVDHAATCGGSCGGTRAAPYATIADGSSAVGTSGKTVAVAAGTYVENVTLASGISVTGGCRAPSWVCDAPAESTVLDARTDSAVTLTLLGGPGTQVGTIRVLNILGNITRTGDITTVDCNGCRVTLADLSIEGGGRGGTTAVNSFTRAVYVRDTGGPVNLQRVRVTAGAGRTNYALTVDNSSNVTVEDSFFTTQERPQNMTTWPSHVTVELSGGPGSARFTHSSFEVNGSGANTGDCIAFDVRGTMETIVSSSFLWMRATPGNGQGIAVRFQGNAANYFIHNTLLGNDVARQATGDYGLVLETSATSGPGVIQAHDNYIENFRYAISGSGRDLLLLNNRWNLIVDSILGVSGTNPISALNVADAGTPTYLQGSSDNFDADCLLADSFNGDPHLMAGSPCIGAALSTDPRKPTLDIDGQPRQCGASRDIGADEVCP